MISKEAVYKYLSEGLLSERLFNFKEEDPQPENQDQNTDQSQTDQEISDPHTDQPNLNWHFIKEDLILYAGSPSEPEAQYYPFADEIRYAEFKKKDDKNKNKDNDDGTKLTKDFKKNLRNFGLAMASGGLAVAADTIDKAFEVDKNKKDKNGKTDKWAEYVKDSFNDLNKFKEHAQENHVPSSQIDDFINTYNEFKKAQQDQQNKDQNQNNQQQNTQQNKTQTQTKTANQNVNKK